MNAGRIFGSLAIATTLFAAPAVMAGERDHYRLGVHAGVSHHGHYDHGRQHRRDDRHHRYHRREAIRHDRHHRRAERRHDRRHDRKHHHGRHHSYHDAELSIGAALLGYIAGYSRYDD